MLQEKYFNYLVSSPPFNTCTSKDVDKLAEELAGALAQLNSRIQLENSAERSESSTPTGQVTNETLNAEDTNATDTGSGSGRTTQPVTVQSLDETPVSANNASDQPPKCRKRVLFTPDVQIGPKKQKKDDQLQQSCEDCLISGK